MKVNYHINFLNIWSQVDDVIKNSVTGEIHVLANTNESLLMTS